MNYSTQSYHRDVNDAVDNLRNKIHDCICFELKENFNNEKNLDDNSVLYIGEDDSELYYAALYEERSTRLLDMSLSDIIAIYDEFNDSCN